MKTYLSSIAGAVLVVALAALVWIWGFCRFYVGPDRMAVVTAMVGDSLPPGQILAKDGQKGIREDVLGEGRHFLNPVLYKHTIVETVRIPPGKVGVVTSKVGEDLPEGEFLAERHQKGIWRSVLGPGKYRMNPYGYHIEIVDAISIPIGYVGVITSLSGEQAPSGEFASDRQKGVRRDILQPGLYYVNPKEFKIDVLEIGVNQVSLLGKTGGEVITKGQIEFQNTAMEQLADNVLRAQQSKRQAYLEKNVESSRSAPRAARAAAAVQAADSKAPSLPDRQDGGAALVLNQFVEFPSRDGFQISLDMTVEVELLPNEVAGIFSRYGDLPAVVDNIIMPQIASISRNKGSEYGAKDFVVGEGREKFQAELTKALAGTLAQKKIIVHNALIRHVDVPAQILEPIRQAGIAIEQNLTNKEKQNTAKKLAELNTELSLIDQRREQVLQETVKMKAETKADEERQVATIKAESVRKCAEIAKQTAGVEAETVRLMGEAEAKSIQLTEGERAKGLQMKAKALGDPLAFNMLEFAERLSEDVTIGVIHAGPGTLWTDLEKARLGDLGGALSIGRQPAKPPQ